MSSLSSPTTANASRSPSPRTPDSSDSLDTAQNDLDTTCWLPERKPSYLESSWHSDNLFGSTKPEDYAMLQLDDLIERHAYEDSPSISLDSPYGACFSPAVSTRSSLPDISSVAPPTSPTYHASFMSLSSKATTATKPVPPPASVPRRQDHSHSHHKIVHPPRQACVNLPIMFPSIPENGTKSRVETQVRVTVDLADPSSSTDPFKYDRVGSWKWLKLPPGTATKRRTRKQGKIDPTPVDVLHLSVSVTCASPPHNPVLSCSSCRAREAKRVAKKLAARVRPARSDSESGDDPSKSSTTREDTSSIIQFNCSEIVDFSTGSVVLPLRITCYCRHHREKVGFHVHFTMMDHNGRFVGAGSSRPIMITDDHKTSTTKHNDLTSAFAARDFDWAQFTASHGDSSTDGRAPSKRNKGTATSKKRGKPYDAASKPARFADTPASSEPSPSPSHATLPSTRSPTPPSFPAFEASIAHQPPPLQYSSFESESSLDGLVTPADVAMSSALTESDYSAPSPEAGPPTAVAPPSVMTHSHPSLLPFLFFEPNMSSQAMHQPLPTIHRLVPNCGPTHGGIEVTVLGANFHPAMTLSCIFGDAPASSTQRWSDNTLVCVLPPRATAGVVSVWFDGFPKMEEHNGGRPPLFTYSDESDRALMELALQVVGLKMTGKIEEARNVAMRIVGNAGDGGNSSNGSSNAPNSMQLSTGPVRDLRPLLFSRANESEDFESLMVDFLSVVDTPLPNGTTVIDTKDALAHQSPSGQTLLHLASFLGFESLVRFLVAHGADLDLRDRNGYTPLHFGAMIGSQEIIRCLVGAGADLEIVDSAGKTAQETVPDDLLVAFEPSTPVNLEDEEADWGDASGEEDAVVLPRRTTLRRRTRRGTDLSRREKTPQPTSPTQNEKKAAFDSIIDEKQPPSFTELIQKTLAQLPGAPHLPLEYMKGIPAVPWNALPQIRVLPVVIPLVPGLPNFLGGDGADGAKGKFTSVELRAAWDRWLAANGAIRDSEIEPPPEYTPRVEPEAGPSTCITKDSKEAAQFNAKASSSRQHGYDALAISEQEMSAFTSYERKTSRKYDRMLLLFWLPILIISLLWACHNGVRFALGTFRSVVAHARTRT